MQKNIKEKLMKIFTLEFWFLGIPFLSAALVFSLWFGLFPGKYLFKYLLPHNHEYFFTYFLLSFVAAFYLVIRVCKTKTNNKEKSLVNFLKTRSKKFIFLSLFVVWQYFNFTGFCYREMKYLSDKELLDRVVSKEFVVKDKEEREKALNLKCSIREGILTQSELDETFSSRKCGAIDYSSWGEFFKKELQEKCSEDLDKYSTKDCGVFYYSSLEEFYGENPNCCEVNNLPIWDGSSPFSQGLIESPGNGVFEKLFGMAVTYVQLSQMPNPESPRITIDHCGNIKKTIERQDHQNFLKKSLTSS